MIDLAAGSLLALAFLVLLLWLLRPQLRRSGNARLLVDQEMDNVLPTHFRFLPQVRQALSAADALYLNEAAPRHIARQALRERREVARHFLSGLLEDFSKLDQLGRMVAALSPEISRQQETERLLLSLRFRLLYGMVWLRLYTGQVPLRKIERLTGLVGRLAARMEEAMAEVNALSAERLHGGFSA